MGKARRPVAAKAHGMGMKYAFAGDRNLAVQVLKFIISQGHQPSALLLADSTQASHAKELRGLVPHLPDEAIITGKDLSSPRALDFLRSLDLDYIFGVHFPHLVSAEVLAIPRHGFLNLHPAYLPYNRGWHTPSWAIIDGTPYGATLHVMSMALDAGDIIHQKTIEVRPDDTANTLYARALGAELEVFIEAWPILVTFCHTRKPQRLDAGTSHRKKDLPAIARIALDEPTTAGALIDRLRALTTNNIGEAAWFERDGRRYRVQVSIHAEPTDGATP